MSLNIVMKIILPVKFSGSHSISHHLLNLTEDCHCRESLENLPPEFHRLSTNSIQFAEIIVVRIPLNLLLPGSHFSQAEHRVGEYVDFDSGMLLSSTVQKACRHPPEILEIDQVNASGFCLTTDQLFCFPEKLSRCFPKIILYKSHILATVFSEMNCCSKSGIHEHSPSSQIHIQVFHGIVRLSSIDFLDHGKDGFRFVRCVQRFLEVVVPCRFCILLTFLVN